MQLEQLDFFTIDQDTAPVVTKKPRRKRESQHEFDLMDALTAPVITWPSPWQLDIPDDVMGAISMARMVALMKGEEMATIPEVVAYLMPRSSEAPMSRECANIYLYVSREYLINYRSVKAEVVDFAPTELDDYEQELLLRLRRWIWEKRRSALKERDRARKRAEK